MDSAKVLAELRQKVDFLRAYSVERDLRGHSRALCYIASSESTKYFIKVYRDNRVDELKYIELIYDLININTAKIIQTDFLPKINATYCIYEFIDGATLNELLPTLSELELEQKGYQVGQEVRKFFVIKGEPKKFQQAFDQELKDLMKLNRAKKVEYNKSHSELLPEIDLDRLEKSIYYLKTFIYATNPVFVHSDINLNNIIFHQDQPYFIDTEGGKIKFRALNFRGNCWWAWSGDNIDKERAVYRGIYRGVFQDKIPDNFHKELAFTMMYEFLLRNKRYENDPEQIHYSFLRWHDNLEQTNYFEDYHFEWF